jgi:hypothetical protein
VVTAVPVHSEFKVVLSFQDSLHVMPVFRTYFDVYRYTVQYAIIVVLMFSDSSKIIVILLSAAFTYFSSCTSSLP